MTEELQTFLEKRLPASGVVGWGALPKQQPVSYQCYVDWLAAQQIESVLKRLVLAAHSFESHEMKPSRLCWVFEHLRVHFAQDSSGTYLAVFVENSEGASHSIVEQVMEDFVTNNLQPWA